MNDSTLTRWVRHFNEGRENVHDDSWIGRSSVVNENLLRAVEEKTQEKKRFTISLLFLHFPYILQSLSRRHYSAMQGYKNWYPATTGATTMVETMSKSSVRYVHQMAI
jgi:hypothetical protein